MAAPVSNSFRLASCPTAPPLPLPGGPRLAVTYMEKCGRAVINYSDITCDYGVFLFSLHVISQECAPSTLWPSDLSFSSSLTKLERRWSQECKRLKRG